jgi:quercetin dioxygenase-like cupin family protein
MSATEHRDDRYSVLLGALGATLRITPADSDSGIAVVEHTLPPGALGAPIHRHSREDEISYVLDGELSVQQGEAVSTVGPGEFVVKNRNVWHTFWNAGTEPVRFLELIAPGAFASYFAEMAAVWDGGMPDAETMGELDAIADTYGVDSKPESIPELCQRHGLTF